MKSRLTLALLLTSAITAPAYADTLTRVSTVPMGGEITGMYLEGRDLFFNVQHPANDLGNGFAKAVVGVIANADFSAGEVAVPQGEDKKIVKSTLGDFQVLISEGDFGKIGHITSIKGEELLVSNDPDFNAFVPTGDNSGYLFTNWENRPGGMSRVMMSRADGGMWTVDEADAKMLDFSSVKGTWVNCFGTLSPWGTPLTSEELYFDDTADWNNADYKYIDDVKVLGDYLGQHPNPYDYGYIVEINDPTATAAPNKLFALGRFSHENAVVMPDNKTVYLSDDGTNVVFFKFIADTAGDLTSGTLFAAKMEQTSPAGTPASEAGFNVSWIELAHGSNAEIAPWIAEYDGVSMDDHKAGETNFISDGDVADWAAGNAKDNRAAFLESRKAAAAKGATAEFRKMEGVNIHLEGAKDGSVPFMYMAMSEISKGMTDDEGDIRVGENKCGVVYEMPLEADFDVKTMVPVVAGGTYDKNNEANACDVNGISNPDNILVLADGTVLIGEDTGKHENNMMWIWKK